MFRAIVIGALIVILGLAVSVDAVATAQPGGTKMKGAWTDPDDKTLPADFKLQGEYVGQIAGGGKLGAQVISLGKDAFQAVLYPGGLPGDGWDGKNKILMDGKRDGAKANFTPATGKRRYIAPKAEEFLATAKFPPEGHKEYTGAIAGDVLTGKTEDGKTFELKKTIRKSPTFDLKPPAGAIVLFNGVSADELKGGRIDKERGAIHTDGKDIQTKRNFMSFSAHIEFMLAYKPEARGQNRGNSGLYMLGQYELQILDSFGLDGKNNECGGIYSKIAPKTNMCWPPLQWQTYDIDFSAAVADGQGKKVKNARVTVKHNGVVIHDNAEIPGKTSIYARSDPEATPGVLLLQGHNNPTAFRNLWVVEKK